MHLARLVALSLTLVVSGLPTHATAQNAGGKPLVYAIVGKETVLDEKNKLFSLSLLVSIDWSKVPAKEKERLLPLIKKDVRLKNCGSLKADKNMAAWFAKNNARTNIKVADAKGKPVLTTSMVWKNCP